ncbi:32764_t:CDS:2, partial [Racocetra persica]
YSSDGILNEPKDTRYIEKIAKLFGLDEQNIEVYKALFGQIWELEKKLEDYYSKYEKLKRRVNLLKAEIEDLDECVDKETLVDLIQEMVSSLIIRKYKKRDLLCEPLNRSDSSLSDSSLSEDSEMVKCYYPKKKVPQRNQERDVNLEWSKRIILTDIQFGVDMGANANYISRKNVKIVYAKDNSIPRVNGFL